MFSLLKNKFVLAALAVMIVGGGIYTLRGKPQAAQTVQVTKGDIAEEVTVTGNTKPAENVSLAFEKGGKIASVFAALGDHVTRGQALVELNLGDLIASRDEARAKMLSEEAKLDSLKAGARIEDIHAKENELAKAESDLTSDYHALPNTLSDAYAKADDAVRKQTDDMFTNDEDINPQLAFTTSDSQAKNDVESLRYQASRELVTWNNENKNISAASAPADLAAALMATRTHLELIRTFLNRAMDAVVAAPALSASSSANYKSELGTARSSVNTALTNVASAADAVSGQKLVVARIADELALKRAGSAPEDIRAEEAQVAAARANLESAEAQISKAILYSPLNGILTKQDAKRGEIAPAGAPLVSVISLSKLEIESNVPEVDIGKIALGNPVRITLDAFPGEEFRGAVTHIDPAETIIEGVVNYKVKVTFATDDPRLKSGLTANLAIQTKLKKSVLLLPQFAILENDKGTFVHKVSSSTAIEVPVSIGIRSKEGTVEILSGAAEGDTVVNVGAKVKQ